MTKRQHATKARHTVRRAGLAGGAIALGLGLVALATVVLVVVQLRAAPGAEAPPASALEHSKGAPDAPVTIVEWGDFQ